MNKASGGDGIPVELFQILKYNAVKGREVKGKGEKERYTNLNAEFQRITRRDNKAFLSDQFSSVQLLSHVQLFVTP